MAHALLGFAPEVERRRLANPQSVVDRLADRCGDKNTATVQDAHQLLALRDLLAVRRQNLPDAAGHGRCQICCRAKGEPLLFLREFGLKLGDPQRFLLDVNVEIDDLLGYLVETLCGARNIVVAVADKQTPPCGIELDLRADQPLPQRLLRVDGDLVFALVLFPAQRRSASRSL